MPLVRNPKTSQALPLQLTYQPNNTNTSDTILDNRATAIKPNSSLPCPISVTPIPWVWNLREFQQEGGSVAPRSSQNQRLGSGWDESSSYGGSYKESSPVPLAAIAKNPPHMAIPEEVMAPVVTTTSLLRTIRSADGIQITANNLRVVREAIGKRPHRIAVVEPVTPLAIRTRGPAPMAPLVMTTIVTAPPAETMDPIRKTLTAPPADMTTKVTALLAEAMDLIHKTLTAPALDVVIMTGARLVLMGALGRLHMVGIVAPGITNMITNHNLILAVPGKILLPMVVRNKHFPMSTGSDEGVTYSFYGGAGRTEEGSSYGTSGRVQGSSPYGRSGRGEGASSYGRSSRDNDNRGSYRDNTGSYDHDDRTCSYGRSGHGEGITTSARSGRGGDNEESSYEPSGQSYDSRDNDTSEYGSWRRAGGDEGQSYDRRGGNRRGNEEESRRYGC